MTVIEVSETTSTATAVVLSGAQREALLRRFESKYPVSTSRTLGEREVQAPTAKAANADRLLQASLITAAASDSQTSCTAVGRRGAHGGARRRPPRTRGHTSRAPEHLAMLRQLLVQYRGEAPEEMLISTGRYLDRVRAAL